MEEKFSYSKIDTYVQCPFKYYLKYVENHNIFSQTIATEIGTMIHECEESIANSIKDSVQIDYTKLKNNIIVKLSEIEQKYPLDFFVPDKSGRTYTEKIYDYLDNRIYNLEAFMKDHPSYKIVGIEEPFSITYNNRIFHGFIDRVFYDTEADKYIIQDIKTYAVKLEKSKLKTPLQFVVYTLAVEQLYNCKKEQVSCQYYLPFCFITQDAGVGDYINNGIVEIENIFSRIENKEFKPSVTPLCNWCEFSCTNPSAPEEGKYLCPYHSLWDRDTRIKTDICKSEVFWKGLDKHTQIAESYIKMKGGEQ